MDLITLGAAKMHTDRTLRLVGFDTRVFGASWNKQSNPALVRTDDAVGKIANVGVDGQAVQNDFDSLPVFGEMRDVSDGLGNVFRRIPKFYIRKQDEANFKSWQVSKTQYSGFYLPWCFWDFVNSRELPYIDVGKYKASLSDDGQRLESKPGKPPLVNRHIVDFRTLARNNNVDGLKGYQQLDIHAIDVLRTLSFVEFANLNSQAIMQGFTTGRYGVESELATVTESDTNRIIVSNTTAAQYRVGQTISVGTSRYGTQVFYGRVITAIEDYDASNKAIHFDGGPVNIAEGNLLQNTGAVNGFSSGIAASSGSVGSNSDGKYPCVYRGIESPYGDIWQWVDGVNINDWQAWAAKNADQYASNLFAAPHEQLGYVNTDVSHYVRQMGFDPAHPYAEFPVEASGAGSTTFYSDYYYQASGQRVASFGGHWSHGADAGVSYWRLSSSSGSAIVIIGGRLLKKPL